VNPELAAQLTKLRALGATDDQIRLYASQWIAEHPAPTGTQPSPQELARIQANARKMYSQGATDAEVRQYLQEEDDAQRQSQSGPVPAFAPSESTNAAPADPNEINAGNLARSALYGGSLHFGDELGIVDKAKEAAFAKQHPVADALAQFGGGAIAPAMLTAALPEFLSGLGGAAAMGAATGGLTGAGSGTDAKSRAEGAAIGAGTGAAGAAAGYGAQTLLSKGLARFIGRIAPDFAAKRAVGQAVTDLLSPSEGARVQARMSDVNALAPGGSSPATAAVPQVGDKSSRFSQMVHTMGANPQAAAAAEDALIGQTNALRAGARRLGAQMEILGGDVPITPALRSALDDVRPVLGKKTPSITPEDELDANPLGLEKSTPVSFDKTQTTMSVQDARDALSRLRYMSRVMSRRGIDANGVALHEVTQARDALEGVLYAERPDLQQLDQSYAKLMDEGRSVNKLLPGVQRSRAVYAANTGGGAAGLPPTTARGAAMSVANAALNPAASAASAAKARASTIFAPGTDIPSLFRMAPFSSAAGRAALTAGRAVRAGIATSLPPALNGLLFPDEQQQEHQP